MANQQSFFPARIVTTRDLPSCLIVPLEYRLLVPLRRTARSCPIH